MNIKSFHLNGLRVDIRAKKLPKHMVRVIAYLNGNEVKDAHFQVPEAELDELVTHLEKSFRDNLTV